MSPPNRAELRELFGRSAAAWATRRHEVADGWWMALSGAPTVLYNLALCYGGGRDGRAAIKQVLETLTGARAPSLLMVAGHGLGEVQVLIDEGWVCVGQMPLMC
ncbi:MAG: hypothetical protein ACYDA6_11795, partial [Solirubrobacteraceae bacterium]